LESIEKELSVAARQSGKQSIERLQNAHARFAASGR
jgi:hypothetical protein